MVACLPFGVDLVEMVGTEIDVGQVAIEDVVGGDEKSMSDRNRRALLAPSSSNASVSGSKIGVS